MTATDLTLAEIQALPVGSVVEDREGDRYARTDPPSYDPTEVWRGDSENVLDSTWPAESLLLFRPVEIVSTP